MIDTFFDAIKVLTAGADFPPLWFFRSRKRKESGKTQRNGGKAEDAGRNWLVWSLFLACYGMVSCCFISHSNWTVIKF